MLAGVGLIVTLVVLAPLAAPGYVLSYDMVFVPRQPLRGELVAPSQSLPRAVPLDALVSLASQAVPGWLLQRLVLAAALLLAAIGAGRLVPARHPVTRLVAAVGYVWTPYLAQRLVIGHWGLLLAYGALPWLVSAAIGVRRGRRGALPVLLVTAVPATVTPTGGLIALAATAVLLVGRCAGRTTAIALAGLLLLNAPWLLAAAATSADGRTDPDGIVAFAARGENWSGPIGALAGTGGIWNAQTSPDSRSSPLTPLVTLAVLALAVLGFRLLRRRWPVGVAVRLGILAGAGFVGAALATLPGVAAPLGWLVASVPGAGLLRDGQKFVMPYALLVALSAALGAERLAVLVTGCASRLGARAVLAGALLLPVVALPDLAFGVAGRLRPVPYPADWDVVAARIAQEPGEVLSLPLGAYRVYPWNGDRTVLDPLPRYVDADVLADDTLYVGDVAVAGENRRASMVREALDRGAPAAVTGVRWVVVQRLAGDPGLPAGTLAGLRLVYAGESLTLYGNPTARRGVPGG